MKPSIAIVICTCALAACGTVVLAVVPCQMKSGSDKPADRLRKDDDPSKPAPARTPDIPPEPCFKASACGDALPEFAWLEGKEVDSRLCGRVPVPCGFQRVAVAMDSFAGWLRYLPLHPKDHFVHLHDGGIKKNQSAHAAVINIDVGTRDLQQCADAVIRLHAEYLWSVNARDGIAYNFTNGMRVPWHRYASGRRVHVEGNRTRWGGGGRPDTSWRNFRRYLDLVFAYAGSASLQKELRDQAVAKVEAGDVLIQGGHPGHAVLVLDAAKNNAGEILILLGQSYMPAQNFHVLRNPNDQSISPWYRVLDLITENGLLTPEWKPFRSNDLKKF